ncbi:type IV pilus biogenesis ATPase and membrane protein PihI [Syntrophotalea carbinolica DSM 2380]|uniref:Type IV pilus biogenesis ATPase and membrane protein PihI n=1 Tax=Syntrophotalea carbinolica (strain DSM 2380 / NBRC 103641 / GraBd1) TaxID=338963 RepID=Q3A685_SYNC1|nr:type IV pilus biogenesis ATPase and membrane protein PihI [Syntrophotalea carbinolica]ABA88122.1 type IV pilus biogenesis ATPase and membrane protein PihI [Syntrophotalea carbinolica DSM 2380]
MNPKLLQQKIVAFEVTGSEVRAAIVAKSGRKFRVLDFASIKRANHEEDLPEVDALRQLARRLNLTGGKVVFVTPLARAFELFMDRRKISNLKHYQLLEAVRWEVEPYTGISGQNALLGAERERKPKLGPGEIAPEESDEQTVTVSAIERNIYRAAKARFKAVGFSLVRIYPPDVSFFMPLHLDAGAAPRAILEVGEDYSNFAILRGGIPEQINTLSISLDTISSHLNGESPVEGLEETLKFTVRQAPSQEALLVSGSGAGNEEVLSYIAGFCPHGAKPLCLSRSAAFTDSVGDAASAAFGTVVGAGVRELRGARERLIGISDREALVPRLKKSAYLMPLVVTGIFVIFLGGHYLFMKHQDRAYKQRIDELSEQLKSRKRQVEKYDGLLAQLKKLEADIAFTENKIVFFEREADRVIVHVIACLRGIGAVVPENVVLTTVTGDAIEREFLVSGQCFDQKEIGLFASALQKKPWCESAVIQKVEADGQEGVLTFELTVKTRLEKS